MGGTQRGGYGAFHIGEPDRIVSAHRWAYEEIIGPIPEGLEIDHLCRTPACVNPAHLEPVTRSVNMLRGQRWDGEKSRKAQAAIGLR